MTYNFEKGFKEKEQILRKSLKGVKTVIVDPESEYELLAKVLNSNCEVVHSIEEIETGKIGEVEKVTIDEGYKFVTEEANEELKRLQRVTKFKLEK